MDRFHPGPLIDSHEFLSLSGARMGHAHQLKAGAYHHLPAKTHHYAYSKGPAVVQINGMGPFDITYVDPKDDPSKAAAPAAAPKKK